MSSLRSEQSSPQGNLLFRQEGLLPLRGITVWNRAVSQDSCSETLKFVFGTWMLKEGGIDRGKFEEVSVRARCCLRGAPG